MAPCAVSPAPHTVVAVGTPYGDIFSGHQRSAATSHAAPEVVAERDLVVEDAASGWCGAVLGIERTHDGEFVRLEDAQGRSRLFALHPAAFHLDGRPVTLVRPPARAAAPAARGRAVLGDRDVAARPAEAGPAPAALDRQLAQLDAGLLRQCGRGEG